MAASIMDSRMYQTLRTKSDHQKANISQCEAVASWLRPEDCKKVYVWYLPCLSQTDAQACAPFAVANLVLFCMSKRGEIEGSFSEYRLQSGLGKQCNSELADKEIRQWYYNFLSGSDQKDLKKLLVQSTSMVLKIWIKYTNFVLSLSTCIVSCQFF